MNRFVAIVAATLLLIVPLRAQQFSTPTDLLETVYEAYVSSGGITNLEPYFSDRLTEEMGEARLSPEIMEKIGVDPLVGAQDANITLLHMADEGGNDDRATVKVSFNNRQHPVQLTFGLVNEPVHGWQIDHLEGRSGAVEWCSRSIVEASNVSGNAAPKQ